MAVVLVLFIALAIGAMVWARYHQARRLGAMHAAAYAQRGVVFASGGGAVATAAHQQGGAQQQVCMQQQHHQGAPAYQQQPVANSLQHATPYPTQPAQAVPYPIDSMTEKPAQDLPPSHSA